MAVRIVLEYNGPMSKFRQSKLRELGVIETGNDHLEGASKGISLVSIESGTAKAPKK